MKKLSQINPIQHPSNLKTRKRVGRGPGAGQGKTAGRGANGAGSRSSGHNHQRFEGGRAPMLRRMPKYAGFKSLKKSFYALVNVAELAEIPAGTDVNIEFFFFNGLFDRKHPRIKVLGDGEIEVALKVQAHSFSKNAKEKIEKAGGSCIIVEEPFWKLLATEENM